ncbi:MAG: terminase [Acidobacteriaceae bacterium]|nr:terminase [Acidobacteriaceae bacterium]
MLEGDAGELAELGRMLDTRPALLHGDSVLEFVAETLLLVRTRNGNLRPLRANAAQRMFEEQRAQHNIVLKARQMGVSTWVSARFFLKTMLVPGTMTVQVAHTREAAEAIFRTVQRFWVNLPEAMREGPARRSRANAGQMVFPEMDSEFRVVSAGDGNAGRGLTIQNLHCSEVARWPEDAAATLAGLRAALVPGGECVLESTPNGAWGCFYDEWRRAEETGTARHFMPWWMEEAYRSRAVETDSLRDDERALMRAHDLTLEQIAFRRGVEASHRGLAAQEYAEDAERCFRQSGECVFDVETIDARMREVGEQGPGKTLTWLPALAGKKYLVAVDTAGGGSEGDYAAAQVIELTTGVQCAELRGRLGTRELAREVAKLARQYNDALVVVERNNHGAGVIAYLDGVEHYRNLYEQGGQAGWLTTAVTRPAMLAEFGALLVERPELFQSRRLLAECRTFVRMKSGRAEAASGEHDDCVMAMAMAHAVRTEVM